MTSLKTSLRRTIAATMASVMITTVFVGCADSSSSLTSADESNISSTTSITTTVSVPDLTPGLTDTNAAFSIKYKYWYDSDYVKEQQSADLSTKAGDSDKCLYDLDGLPIHIDDDGNEFIISGRTEVSLVDGKLPLINLSELRTEGEGEDGGGQRVYVVSDTASTAVLPDGCYWVGDGSNAFIDPAGNLWINRNPESIPYALRNEDNGYT